MFWWLPQTSSPKPVANVGFINRSLTPLDPVGLPFAYRHPQDVRSQLADAALIGYPAGQDDPTADKSLASEGRVARPPPGPEFLPCELR